MSSACDRTEQRVGKHNQIILPPSRKVGAAGRKQLVINIPENLKGKHGHMHLEAAAETDFDAPKQAAWTDAEAPSGEGAMTLKWEVVEGCCMTVHWPSNTSTKKGHA